MQLVGRKDEIKNLEWDLQKSEPQFIAIYGRRRIGKTYLVREMFNDSFTFSHTGLRGGDRKSQLAAFRASLVRYGDMKCPVLKDWMSAFDKLNKLISGAPAGRKVIFIDELPWMDTPRSDLLVGLEFFWNARASARAEKDVFLVVCGSAASWIVKNLLGNTGGLYGRLTDRIWLRPFTLLECETYAERLGLSMSRQDICEAYMIFGGVPYYWNLLRPDMSLAQNIDALFFSQHGALRDEFRFLYESLFRNATEHIHIVEALSKKKSGMTRDEIAAAANQKPGGNFKIRLEELEQCDFIRKYLLPGRKNRGAVFQLMDNFTLFHYAFASVHDEGDEHRWSSSQSSQRIAAWRGLSFERVCLQHVDSIKKALGISGVRTSAYSWRTAAAADGGGAQIDLVIDRDDGIVNLCEIKYSSDPYEIDAEEAARLRARKAAFIRDTGTRKTCRTTLITSSGLKPNKYRWTAEAELSLDDLFQ